MLLRYKKLLGSTNMELGKITIVKDLRSVWKNEAYDFTRWLAQDENISLLGEELGLDISVIKTEANVGSFNVDILAEDPQTADKIIIENQLERTNHDHLGKIITYASGFDAKHIIWIVKDVREEHSQAINWLNEHTDEDINFFLIKIELWKIGNSAIAPKFQIVARPNEWGKAVKSSAGKETEATKAQNFSYNLWSDFKEYALQHNPKYSLQLPLRQNWYNISIGTSAACICLKSITGKNTICCQFYIHNNHNLFHFMEQYKEEIEEKIGFPLEWNYKEDRKASYIEVKKSFDFSNKEEYLSWMYKTVGKFYDVFSQYVRKYK